MADGRIEIDTRINNDGADKGLKDLSEKLKKSGEGFKNVGEEMSKYVSLPLAAVGGTAMKIASDFDSANGKIQAQLGITAEEAKKLGVIAQDVWANGFGENIDEVSASLVKVQQNMGNMPDNVLKEMTQDAHILAQTFDADINDSTKTAGNMMKNFGVDGKTAMDLITYGFQMGGDYSGELLDTLNEYSPQFASMGMSAQDMMGVLIAGAQAGAFNLDKVGDAVKEFNIRAQDGSKTTSEGFAAIGLNADQMGQAIAEGGDKGKMAFEATIAALANMKDPVQQNIAGVNLFGTQWEDLRGTVVKSMAEGVNSVDGFQGATERAGKAVQDSFGARVQKAWRQLQKDLQPLGDLLLNLAEDVLPKISSAVKDMTDWFNGLSPSVQKIVLGVGLFLGALGPVLVIIGTLITSISTIIGVLAPLGTFLLGTAESAGFLATAFAFITGPVGIVIGIIVALIAVGVLLWKNWDTVKAFLIDTWNVIRDTAINVWNGIASFFTDMWNGIVETATGIWNGIVTFFQGLWAGIQAIFNAAINGIVAVAMNLWNTFGGSIMQIFDGISTYFSGAWEVIKNIFAGALLLIIDLVTGNFDALKTDALAIWGNIKDGLSQMWEGIKGIFFGALSFIQTYITTVWNFIKSISLSVWEGIKSGISASIEGIKKFITDGFNFAKSFISNAANSAKDGAINGFNAMIDGIKSALSWLKSTISDAWNGAISFLKGIDLGQIGRNIIQGLIDGIGGMLGSVKKKVSELADLIPKGLRDFLGIHSPSRVLRDEVGKYIPEGLAKGIEGNMDIVTKATNQMALETIPIIPSSLGISTSAPSTTSTNSALQNMPPIVVQSVLNGRVIAEETVEPMSYLLRQKLIPRRV